MRRNAPPRQTGKPLALKGHLLRTRCSLRATRNHSREVEIFCGVGWWEGFETNTSECKDAYRFVRLQRPRTEFDEVRDVRGGTCVPIRGRTSRFLRVYAPKH